METTLSGNLQPRLMEIYGMRMKKGGKGGLSNMKKGQKKTMKGEKKKKKARK